MKIEYRKGDLLKTEIPYIAHGCNAQGVMGSGVAKVIREKWPLAFQVYWEDYIEASNSGSGLGGGDWHVISTIIETNFTKTRPVVYSLD